jgi:hypothetical protein
LPNGKHVVATRPYIPSKVSYQNIVVYPIDINLIQPGLRPNVLLEANYQNMIIYPMIHTGNSKFSTRSSVQPKTVHSWITHPGIAYPRIIHSAKTIKK